MIFVFAYLACLLLCLAFFVTREKTRQAAFVNHARRHGVADIRAALAEKGVALPKAVPAIVGVASAATALALWVPVALVLWAFWRR